MVLTKLCLEGLPVHLCSRTLFETNAAPAWEASYWLVDRSRAHVGLREGGFTTGAKGVRDRPAGERCTRLAGVERE